MLINYSKNIINQYLSKIDDISSNEIFELYNYLKNHKYKINDLKMNQCMNFYPNNNFISPTLFKKTKEYNNCLNINWNIINDKNKKINCSFYFYSKSFNEINKKLLKHLIDSISFIISFKNKTHNYEIHFVPLNDKKKYNSNTKSLTKHLINSGCSTIKDIDTTIYIWRLEELNKVLFHEVIHSFINYDNYEIINTNITTKKLLNKYKKRYKLYSRKIHFDEPFCETWARILNCFYISNEYHINNQYDYFCKLLSFEIFYSKQISLNILKLKEKNNILLDDHTNISSYYLITSELLNNIHNFLSFTKKNNYLYLNDIESFYIHLNNLKKINNKKQLININSLRMSCMELQI